jgi:Uma2 family endonuclease
VSRPSAAYEVDPKDPRAPSQEVWDALHPDERRRVLEMLPSEIERAEPPEGDGHSRPKHRAFDTLLEHYRRLRRRIYLAMELPVYYPAEAMFAPDLLAVLDVDAHERDHWTVSHEGRGLDFVLEIHIRGRAKKDFEENVERYARLGIPEYFAFAPRRGRLAGWHLPDPGARVYRPIVPQGGRWHSRVLGLDLALEDTALRFYHGAAALLDTSELIARLSSMVDAATQRAEDESRRAEAETQRAERYAARLRELGIDPDEIH